MALEVGEKCKLSNMRGGSRDFPLLGADFFDDVICLDIWKFVWLGSAISKKNLMIFRYNEPDKKLNCLNFATMTSEFVSILNEHFPLTISLFWEGYNID